MSHKSQIAALDRAAAQLESSWQASGPFRRGSTVYMARTQPKKHGLPDLHEGWGFWAAGVDADTGDPLSTEAFYERRSDADDFAESLERQGVRVRVVEGNPGRRRSGRNPGAVETGFTRRLRWQPVHHTCGHWEERLMRDRGEDADPARAGNRCDRCEPRYTGEQRITPKDIFDTWEDANAACDLRNREDRR